MTLVLGARPVNQNRLEMSRTRMRLLHAAMALMFFDLANLASQTPSPIAEAELFKRLNSTIDSLAKIEQFSGVVVLAKNGTPVFQRAVGLSDREANLSNGIQTAFNIGSINKQFTAI